MIKILIIFTTLFVTSAFSVCDGFSVYDNGITITQQGNQITSTVTSLPFYSQNCASLYLNMSELDYSFQMALAGQLAGFTFMFVTLMFLFLMGKRR